APLLGSSKTRAIRMAPGSPPEGAANRRRSPAGSTSPYHGVPVGEPPPSVTRRAWSASLCICVTSSCTEANFSVLRSRAAKAPAVTAHDDALYPVRPAESPRRRFDVAGRQAFPYVARRDRDPVLHKQGHAFGDEIVFLAEFGEQV